ncbi:GAF domain-containing protein [Halobellus sp. EA9]|uniref:GAF domain-containing protein n=1 Tax=Halobellus sp. EA9 TaxID=3421647 RepID=UPI003EB73946
MSGDPAGGRVLLVTSIGDATDGGSDEVERDSGGEWTRGGTEAEPGGDGWQFDGDGEIDANAEVVVETLEEELSVEVVVRCRDTAVEYVEELGPTLDCVVVLGDDRALIRSLIEDDAVPTVVYEPPFVETVETSGPTESTIRELVERVRAEVGAAKRTSHLRESNARLTALSHFAEDITACETVGAVVERTLDATTQALAYDYAVIYLLEGDRLLPRATSLPDASVRPLGVDEGIAGRTLRSGESEIVSDLQSVEDARPQTDELHAGISVPIDGRGVIQVASGARAAFDESDLEFVEILAGYAREALERIEREVTLRRERDRLHAFFDGLPAPAVYVERRDGELRVEEVNGAYDEQFGTVRSGRPLADVADVSETEQFEAALGTAGVSTGVVERSTAAGGVGTFALHVVAVSPPGSDECAYGIYVDPADDGSVPGYFG